MGMLWPPGAGRAGDMAAAHPAPIQNCVSEFGFINWNRPQIPHHEAVKACGKNKAAHDSKSAYVDRGCISK